MSHSTRCHRKSSKGYRRCVFQLEPLESRTLLNGLTIIAHGTETFSGVGSTSRPAWIVDMGNAIAKRLGGNTPIYAIRVEPGGAAGVQVTSFVHLSGAATSAGSTSGQTILLLDWAAASNVNLFALSADFSTTAVASVVMPYLTTAIPSAGLTAPLAEGAIQLIGHSRGGSLISELANDLGKVGLWVDQVTFLDPRPVPPDPLVPQLKSNVAFSDTYYQTSGDGFLTPNGLTISGSANFGPLTVNGGLGSTHDNLVLFYQGTIDTSASANIETITVPSNYYSGNGLNRSAIGYYFSLMGGGASRAPASGLSTAFGGSASRSSITRSGSQWADIASVVPSAGQLGAGQTFAATYRYNSYNTTASVQWFLDPDNNPYNNNSIALGSAQTLAATGDSILQATATLNTGNVGLGAYYLVGRITNATGTRYAYSSAISVSAVAPIGNIDTAGPSFLQGWAVDADSPSTAVAIRVDVDGTTFTSTTAGLARPDLAKAFGSANHGFSVDLSSLSVGIHRVDVYALDTTTNNPTLIGSRTCTTNHAPLGNIDWFDGSALAGWAYDPDAPTTSIQVRYSVDNNAPSFLPTNQDRADVGAYFGINNTHGFAVFLPQLTAGSHTVTMFAVDPLTQGLTPIGSRTVTVANPAGNLLPQANVEALTSNLVAGWAYDPSTPGTSINIRIDIDGAAGTPFAANVARADLASLPGGPAYSFNHALSLAPGEHKIDVYAYDSTSSTPVFLASKIVYQLSNLSPSIPAAPLGSLDIVSASQIAGWAYFAPLAAAGLTSVPIRIDIDNLPTASAYTTTARGDITSTFSAGNWAYSVTPPALSPGTHTISLYVIDPLTLNATLIVSRQMVTA